MRQLILETNAQSLQGNELISVGPVGIMITPPIDEDYWLYRVQLWKDQAIVAFPKFNTIGIGFAQEEDWNTNFPYTQDAQAVYEHIKHNKKYDEIPDWECREAIKLIQEAIRESKMEAQG
jgi:hypothetical protein